MYYEKLLSRKNKSLYCKDKWMSDEKHLFKMQKLNQY